MTVLTPKGMSVASQSDDHFLRNHGVGSIDHSDYTFETKGTFELTKGVEIKLGAQLEVKPSEINY